LIKNTLIVSSEFPPGPGGIGNHAYCLASGLNDAMYTVHVITIQRDQKKDLEFDKSLPFSVSRILSGHALNKTKFIMKTIARLSRDGPLIVIASGMAMLVVCGWYSLIFKRRDIKFLLVAHGIDINPTSFIYRGLVAIGIKGFQTIIPVSSYTATKIKGINRKKLKIINNGFDSKKFIGDTSQIERKKIGNPSLVTVGSVTFRKGQINVIKALPLLMESFPNIHYHIIGLDCEKSALVKLAKELGVIDCITFHGPLNDITMKAQLEAADIFVMLSNHDSAGDFEGFGIAVLEANYLGLPAIGSSNSGLQDSIRPGYSGLLITSDNGLEFKRAIISILDRYEQYSEHAKEHASHFLWTEVINQYIDILKNA